MASIWLIYTGGAIVLAWGIAHIAPTRAVVAGFGPLSPDNRRIITMEWVAEGLGLAFVGVLVLVTAYVSGTGDATALLVYRLAAGALVVFALWTLIAGFRTSILPIRLCPAVLTVAAALLVAGAAG